MWIVTLFLLLNLKHFLCDYVFQTQRMVETKGTYGSLGGIEHASIHALGTIIAICLALPWDPVVHVVAVVLGLLDGVIHYHIDWVKSNQTKNLTSNDRLFWLYHGADQSLHYLTYILIISIILYI